MFVSDSVLGRLDGRANGADIVLVLDGYQAIFRTGASGEPDLMAFVLGEVHKDAEEHVAELRRVNGAYECARDSLLDRAPAILASDTAGLASAMHVIITSQDGGSPPNVRSLGRRANLRA